MATTLPVSDTSVVRGGGALPAYFAGLLPEGRRLGALRRAVKTSVDDELSLLLTVGTDTLGDVQVVPQGSLLAPAAAGVQLDPARPLRFQDVVDDLEVRPDRPGLAGVQDKVSATMINVPAVRTGNRFILKLDPPEYPGLVANEAVFLRASARSGLLTGQAELHRDVEGRAGLAVLRFDRPGEVSLAVEDGCQVQGRAPGDKYLVGYAATFAALAAVCDAHAKNFSVLQARDGEWFVSPGYDLHSSQPYGDSTLAIPVNDRRSDVGAADVLAVGSALGLPEPSCDASCAWPSSRWTAGCRSWRSCPTTELGSTSWCASSGSVRVA